LLLDPETGDLDLSKGLRLTSGLAEYTRQQLRINLGVFLGEWFLDQRLGLPVFRDLIGQPFDPALAQSIYRQGIAKTRGVGSTGPVIATQGPDRRLQIEADNVQTLEGEDVPFEPLILGDL
jgi:hypothetical protein